MIVFDAFQIHYKPAPDVPRVLHMVYIRQGIRHTCNCLIYWMKYFHILMAVIT